MSSNLHIVNLWKKNYSKWYSSGVIRGYSFSTTVYSDAIGIQLYPKYYGFLYTKIIITSFSRRQIIHFRKFQRLRICIGFIFFRSKYLSQTYFRLVIIRQYVLFTVIVLYRDELLYMLIKNCVYKKADVKHTSD